jgi:kinetochore protein Nuf2
MASGFLPTDFCTPGGPSGASSNMAQPQFVFPLLKYAVILQCLNELGVDFLNKQELAEPTRHKEKVKKVFWALLDICCGITEEDLAKRAPSTDHLKFPELHEEFTDMLFFQELKSLMVTCGLHDFSWRDLYHPTSKRLRVQFSAVINMAKFREEQLKVYGELNEPRNQLLKTLEEIHSEHAQLSEHLQEVQVESQDKMEQMDKVIGECQNLETEIARNNKLQASKRELAATLKREAAGLKDELASATWAMQESQSEEERLMGQVVSSPSRRTKELAVKKERLEKEKEEARNLLEDLQSNKTKIVQLQQATKIVGETSVLQKQVLEEAAKYEQAMGQVDDTTKDVEENQENAQQIANETEEDERAWMRTEEKITHMRKQGKMKMQATQDRLDTAKNQLMVVEKERRDGMAKVEAGEQEVRALEAQMKTEQEKTMQEIAELVTEYKEMENAFVMRNEQRMTAIGAVV